MSLREDPAWAAYKFGFMLLGIGIVASYMAITSATGFLAHRSTFAAILAVVPSAISFYLAARVFGAIRRNKRRGTGVPGSS